MKKGALIILSGPSGVGKGTVRIELMKHKELNLWFSVSMTTRSPRPGEQDGREYFFVTNDEFEKNLKEDNLLEHAEFVANKYGTPRSKVEEMREKGYNVILEIETKGAAQVMSKFDDSELCTIFILPPSIEELERRIRGRSTESEEVIAGRLAKARGEMDLAKNYQYSVRNVTVSQCADDIAKIILNKVNANA
ncbi:MAG: guanylate kinase [Bacilli bacterium]|nr:guanylate kinase [Bacilli bacterium]